MRPVNFGVRYTGCVHSGKVGKGNDDEAEHGLVLGHHGLVAVVGSGFVCGKLRDYGQGVARQQHAHGLYQWATR